MANNRMWLAHRPSGERVYIGKRMGYGWYRNDVDGDLTGAIAEFFDKVEKSASGDQDDFVLQLEILPEESP